MLDTGDVKNSSEKSGVNEIGAFSERNTEGESKEADPADPDIVYWTQGGTVWHTERECSALRRSKEIISGTVEEAVFVGKERACQKCS